MFRPRSIGLLLALVTLLIFLPAISFQFINFDDPSYVADNPTVKAGLTWAGVKWAFMGVHVSNWHPLTWLSHMIDCDLFRVNPAGPHLVNILFHAINAALFFALFFRLTKKLWPSVFIAALFAWHPLHVESVAWVSERKDVLSTFFALLTLLSYGRYVQEKRRSSFWLALFYFALALLSKPMPVTLPAVMLLLDYWPLNRFSESNTPGENFIEPNPRSSVFKLKWSVLIEKWPFFLLAGATCIVTCLSQHDALNTLKNVPFNLRLENALTAYGGYLYKMVWPVNLTIFYPLHAHIAWQLLAESAIVLVGVSIISLLEWKRSPWLIVGWLWFLGALVPVIGLVQVGSQAMADRYSYFPLIGIFLAITFSAQALTDHFGFLKKWFVAAAVLILGLCLVLTENQLRYWRDSESLFTHALTVTTSDLAHLCLGEAMHEQKKDREAMNQYIMAWRLNPDSELVNGSIAYMLNDEGKSAQAAIYYQKALRQGSQNPALYKNYGMILAKLNRFDEAMSQYTAAEHLDATSASTHILMGYLLLQQGKDTEALKQFRTAMQLDPINYQLAIFTANLLAATTDPLARNGEESKTIAEKLIKQVGDQQPAALDALAMANAETGEYEKAIQLQQEAVRLAETKGSKIDLEVMQKRLESYQKHQPWRESFKRTPTPQKLTPQ